MNANGLNGSLCVNSAKAGQRKRGASDDVMSDVVIDWHGTSDVEVGLGNLAAGIGGVARKPGRPIRCVGVGIDLAVARGDVLKAASRCTRISDVSEFHERYLG